MKKALTKWQQTKWVEQNDYKMLRNNVIKNTYPWQNDRGKQNDKWTVNEMPEDDMPIEKITFVKWQQTKCLFYTMSVDEMLVVNLTFDKMLAHKMSVLQNACGRNISRQIDNIQNDNRQNVWRRNASR